ncbi:unnamed protein product [Linum tenue]|uniref:Uncharacterized protein n=1 Tax=Linum tenue TaxID=586396 RepID=A0AAV0JXE3_9ROSI|nr:unnamed protein product [Linum tenue]
MASLRKRTRNKTPYYHILIHFPFFFLVIIVGLKFMCITILFYTQFVVYKHIMI